GATFNLELWIGTQPGTWNLEPGTLHFFFTINLIKENIMKNIVFSFVLLFGLLFSLSSLKEVIASNPTGSVTAATASPELMAQKSSGSATATIVREKEGVKLQFEQSTDGAEI